MGVSAKILRFREKTAKKIFNFREFLSASTWAVAWFLQGHLSGHFCSVFILRYTRKIAGLR